MSKSANLPTHVPSKDVLDKACSALLWVTAPCAITQNHPVELIFLGPNITEELDWNFTLKETGRAALPQTREEHQGVARVMWQPLRNLASSGLLLRGKGGHEEGDQLAAAPASSPRRHDAVLKQSRHRGPELYENGNLAEAIRKNLSFKEHSIAFLERCAFPRTSVSQAHVAVEGVHAREYTQ
ncbi:hypothetical protein TREES_T100009641 [Tupaia chinensis]|uniref:Uncharacterized protein n=1 Tax=Tupaia chinensis TaxID=246437 RepID=L9LC76_TUPCH|nr:hypothetical protein TREES_T100009641 [Tupaia chinensis]